MTSALAKALADRHLGIGCDQLILLEPSATADVKMRIWNHDGGEVESCGNASRCVVALTGAKTLETGGGMVEGGTFGARGRGQPAPAPLRLGRGPAHLSDGHGAACRWPGGRSSIRWRSASAIRTWSSSSPTRRMIDLVSQGPSIEHDPAFPERINVNVASVRDDGIHLRTWERGSGMTLACGTGACATAVAAIVQKKAASPVKVHMRGGALTISWAPGEPIRMRGSATHVFKGEIDLEAVRLMGARRSPSAAGSTSPRARRCAALAGDDAIIVNSCAVTNEAVRQTRQAIRRAHREAPDKRIIVTGCAAQLDPDELRGDAGGDQGHRQCRQVSRRSFRQ